MLSKTLAGVRVNRAVVPRINRISISPLIQLRPGSNVKISTGIVGVPVVPHAREILIKLYEKYLTEIEVFEPDSPYRQQMTKVVQHRLDICKSTEDIFQIEEQIGSQLEELITETEEEFLLIGMLLREKPWEPRSKWEKPWLLSSPPK
eukprot:TRINITY_DN15897_c0_g1_i2.p1 TRINITY_DN15897_c0_g1~~TRINITY_DN15897_c0_g1_i2.p1  ORF type:complete len:148 (-),score=15.47 TRINITY_DN15897_c0_g1_i2:42-485(-)